MRTIRGVDPNAVVAFVAVAAEKSFRGAARLLGVPKSTVSQRVAELEARLGARLLTRTTRSVTLTDIGARYHREVAPAVAALSSAEAVVSSLQARPAGRLRLTAPIELGQVVMGHVLSPYVARHPDVKVEVDLTDRRVDLVDEGYDLAIRVGPLRDSRLMARRLGPPMHVGLYASPSYLEGAGVPQRPRDLAGHRCLVMQGSYAATAWEFRVGKRAVNVSIAPAVAVNSFNVLAFLAASGAGIARLPARLACGPLAERAITEVLGRFALPARQTFAVYPSGRNVSPAVRAMLELLLERFQVAPWGQS